MRYVAYPRVPKVLAKKIVPLFWSYLIAAESPNGVLQLTLQIYIGINPIFRAGAGHGWH